MAHGNGQTDLDQNSSYLDPNRPESWGEEVSTAPAGWSVEELPIRLSVLVHENEFAGLRGPRRVLDALTQIDVDCLYVDDYRLVKDMEAQER